MPSKYKSKCAKPVTKQMSQYKEMIMRVNQPKPTCTNCGAVNYDATNRFSKCYCGGTYQKASDTTRVS